MAERSKATDSSSVTGNSAQVRTLPYAFPNFCGLSSVGERQTEDLEAMCSIHIARINFFKIIFKVKCKKPLFFSIK